MTTHTPEPDAYEPDEIALAVLQHIHRADYPDPVKDLPEELGLDPLEVEHRLDKLIEHHYVDDDYLNPVRGYSRYSLSPLGREYLVKRKSIAAQQKPTPNEKLEKTLTLLNSFSSNLPKHRIDVGEADEYHALLETAEQELGCDFSEYRIPPSAIKSIEIPQSMSFDAWGNPTSEYTPKYDRFIPATAFKRKLDALLAFLNQKRS